MALKKAEPPMLSTQPSRSTVHVEKAKEQASKPIVKEARLNVRIDAELHEKFWRACKRNESDMTTVIQEFVGQYVEKYSR